ncbi:hypothetical protein ACFWG6_35135 [Streptomyces erythrochromogenes]|uniref:hypothetical protein n=1 Tax=Streptomyces erythrochromogenes TaxID=285574 RepID=UPI00362ECE49
MPASVIHDDPPTIFAKFTDGTSCTVRIRNSPNATLAGDLLLGLADLVKPHGDLDTTGSVEGYTTAIRHMCNKLAEAGFYGSAAALTRGRLSQFWMGAGHPVNEYKARAMLRRWDDVHGLLKPDVRALVDGRSYAIAHQRDRTPLSPYSEGEWSRLTEACKQVVKRDFQQFKEAMAAAERGQDPHAGGWGVDNVRWAMVNWGPAKAAPVVRWRPDHPSGLREKQFPYAIARDTAVVFPNTSTVIAYRLLLGIYTGIVPDGLADLGLSDVDWAGDSTILLDYVKGRTAPENLVLSARASRLLQQWLEHSAPGRRFAPDHLKDELWVRYSDITKGWITNPEDPGVLKFWVRRAGLLDDKGGELWLHRHRIRTTHGAMRERRHWKGSRRATIDPNRSPAVEGDNYLTLGTKAQREMVNDVIADAQMDMMRRAQPPMVLTQESVAALVRDYPAQVAALELTDEVLAELVSGQRDVFSASCGDQLSGLHGPKGKPCPARPWVCLACPLALFTPRHLPNLMRLRAFFSAMWQQMPAAEFMPLFGFYSQRLDAILTPDVHFSPEALAEAAAQVGDTDDELPLRAEERTVR